MPTKKQFHEDLESILELEAGAIKGDESLNQIPWDSMAVVMLIAMVDEKYSVSIAPSKLASAKTVADLYDLVSS